MGTWQQVGGHSWLSLMQQGRWDADSIFIEIKTAAGNTAAYLSPKSDGLKECWPDATLNGISKLTFELPLTSAKWTEITSNCRIIAGGREYSILNDNAIDIVRDGKKLWGKVTAFETWKLLDKDFVSVANDGTTPSWAQVKILSGGTAAGGYPAGSAGSALTYLLADSGWTLGTCDVTGTFDLETEKESRLANIQKVQELWGGLLVWDSINKTVSLRSETLWQNYTGYQIRYAKNLKAITRTTNNNIITRLYAFGKDGLNIGSVNGGVIYLDNNTYSSDIYEGVLENQNITDPQELKDWATAELAKLCQPRHNYQVKTVDTTVLPQWAHETYSLGDMADVIDTDCGGISDRCRLIRHKYNLFQPWLCDMELGDPVKTMASMIASGVNAGDFVKEALKPNLGVRNILKGFIDNFATTINGASGGYECIDGVATWYELVDGVKTGKLVRLTPAGMYISDDGGVTLKLAMTGDGILANTIICSALYALSSEDGYTKLVDSGLKVYDNLNNLRVWIGQYALNKFGIKIWDSTGSVVLLDEDGIMQTWQDSRADNVDATHGLLLNVYLPAETKSVHKAILRFKLQAFRAYETGAASGGGSTSGSSSTNSSGSSSQETSGNSSLSDTVESSGGVSGASYTCGFYTDTEDGHLHTIPSGTVLMVQGGGTVTWGYGGSHSHDVANHFHYINHTHQNPHTHQIPHTHSTPDHVHPIAYGIYESTSPTSVTVTVGATTVGTYTAGQDNIDISSYLTIGTWNTVTITPNQLGRVDSSVFIQAKMGV